MKIAWQTRSQLLHDSIVQNELRSGANGGNIYDYQAVQALVNNHELSAFSKAVWQNENPLSYWLRMRAQPDAKLSILEPTPVVFGTFSKQQKYVAIVHHIDFDKIQNSKKHRWFFNRLLKRLKKVDKIITVSKYWKEYLEEKGCKHVEVIYNSFDIQKYKFDSNELRLFKLKHGFNSNKHLVYIGNATAEKGVYEVYEALKDLKGIQLVMTGSSNQAKDLPVPFLSLPDKEYRMLLASCDVVLAFSSMMEGWNRIAHEAMLCQVPVIGSGVGGMQELLEGGKQIISSNKKDLKSHVEKAIVRKKELGRLGYSYACQFDLNYFNKAWNDVITSLT